MKNRPYILYLIDNREVDTISQKFREGVENRVSDFKRGFDKELWAIVNLYSQYMDCFMRNQTAVVIEFYDSKEQYLSDISIKHEKIHFTN